MFGYGAVSVRLAVSLILALVGSLTFGRAQAQAVVSHEFVTSFDGSETPAGTFAGVGGVSVARESDDVYVADTGNGVIDKFDANGKYVSQITGVETPAGEFALLPPGSIAVDNSTDGSDLSAGDLYVVDGGHNVIDKFDASGKYIGQVTEGFNATVRNVSVDGAGNVWVYEELGGTFDARVSEFTSTGESVFQFSSGGLAWPAFAVDATGHTYAATFTIVGKHDSAGKSEGTVDECSGCQAGIAVDLSTGHVYIDDGAVMREFDETRELVDEFGQAQLATGDNRGGIGVNPSTGRVYVGSAAKEEVFVYDPTPGPRVIPQSASNVKVSSVTLNAEVNPEGAETTYQFEYGPTTGYGGAIPAAPAEVGSGIGFTHVSAELAGLEGSTIYHYRIVATNINGTVTSADGTFTTAPIQTIENLSVTNLSSSSATLNARINPHGLETSYHFEWGPDATYGHDVPSSNAVAGGGSVPVDVSAAIVGLEPDRTYHWRLVTVSEAGVKASSDHSFIYERHGGALPDNRAYELVTPPNKNGALIGDTFIVTSSTKVSADGIRVIASSIQCFGGAKSCTAVRNKIGSAFEFSRSAAGWQTTPLAPSTTEFEALTTLNYDATDGVSLFSAPNPVSHQDDFYLRRADGSLTRLGPMASSEIGMAGPAAAETYLSRGATHLVWTSTETLWPFDATENEKRIYEISPGAVEPRLVAVTGGPGSTDLIDRCGADAARAPGSLSEDGSTFFMTLFKCAEGGSGVNAGVAMPVSEVFARRDGEETIAISEPEPNSACTSEACVANTGPEHQTQFRDAEFEGASRDGRVAYFTSTQQLTNDASEDPRVGDSAFKEGSCASTSGANGCNLYEFECASCVNAAERQLVDISAGDSSGGGPHVRGVVAVSEDGSHVYFVAGGVLTATPNAAGDLPKARADNLYGYERDARHPAGRIMFIATLPSTDENEWSTVVGNPANVTPDGRFLVFLSRGQLTPDDSSISGASQVFRYDAESEVLTRLSVGEHGFNNDGNGSSPTACEPGVCSEDARIVSARRATALSGPRSGPTMSDDGQFVFFQSPVALVPGALDDVVIGGEGHGRPAYAQNVYEWHDGDVRLISDGHDVSVNSGQTELCAGLLSSVCLLGTDSSGSNVFFSTADSLVPQDIDSELDYYDARVCAAASPCVAAPVGSVECEGEGCHAEDEAAPAASTPASVTFVGSGNAGSASVMRVGHVKVKRSARGARLSLMVSVPAGGRLSVSGNRLRNFSRSVPGAGSYRLVVSLNANGRRALHRWRRLRVGLRIGYRTSAGAGSVALVSVLVRR